MELAQEPHLPVDLVESSSHGSAVLKVDPRPGKSTSRAALPTRLPGNSAQLLLDPLVDRLPGSSVLEDTVATASTVEVAATVALRHGSNPEVTIEVRTTTVVAMAVDMADMVATEEEEEDMARVHLREARLLGCSRKHTQATAPQAWTTMALRPHLHHRLVAFHLRPHLATCRRLLRRRRSSGCQHRIRTTPLLNKSKACIRMCDQKTE
jgi:hypothetical protein